MSLLKQAKIELEELQKDLEEAERRRSAYAMEVNVITDHINKLKNKQKSMEIAIVELERWFKDK